MWVAGGSATLPSSDRCRDLAQWPCSHITALQPHITRPDVTQSAEVPLTFDPVKPNMAFKAEGWAATNLFQHAVQGFRAADVETDEDGVGVGIGEGSHVVIVWRSWNQREKNMHLQAVTQKHLHNQCSQRRGGQLRLRTFPDSVCSFAILGLM